MALEDLYQKFKRRYFFAKRSLGKNGREIWALKFKTMDDEVGKAVSSDIAGFFDYGHINLEGKITGLNSFIRKHFIDEIPQLYNIFIKRDMSLVGVRPMRECDWQHYPQELKREALKYKPGLMGIQYALKDRNDFEACKKEMFDYLKEKEKHPVLTDAKYFFSIVYNVVFRGIRSR